VDFTLSPTFISRLNAKFRKFSTYAYANFAIDDNCAGKNLLCCSAVILFLVYELERNIYDHRYLEYAIYDINSEIKVIRRTLQDITARAYLSDDKRLMM
jgi:hypothetical protein